VAPLRASPDAVPLDTTAMGFDDQVRVIVELARPIFGRGYSEGPGPERR
jgi:cytidylate kinase